jgi:hypothetical protein
MDRRPEPRTRSRQTKLRRGPGSPFCLVEQGYGVCGARDERAHAGRQQQLVDQLGHDVLPRSGSGKTTTGSRNFGSATACGPLGFYCPDEGRPRGNTRSITIGVSWPRNFGQKAVQNQCPGLAWIRFVNRRPGVRDPHPAPVKSNAYSDFHGRLIKQFPPKAHSRAHRSPLARYFGFPARLAHARQSLWPVAQFCRRRIAEIHDYFRNRSEGLRDLTRFFNLHCGELQNHPRTWTGLKLQ